MQHADDVNSRRENVGGSLVHSMHLMYSADSTNVDGSRGGELDVIGSV